MSGFIRHQRIFPHVGTTSIGTSGLPYGGDAVLITVDLTAGVMQSIVHGLGIQDISYSVRDINGEEVQCIILDTPTNPTNSFDITTFADYAANTVKVIVQGHQ